MRPIHIVLLDRPRPAVLLTREEVRWGVRELVTVAPITSVIRGLSVEVEAGADEGRDRESVINCDAIQTVRADRVGRLIGHLPDAAEPMLADAILAAFDLSASG